MDPPLNGVEYEFWRRIRNAGFVRGGLFLRDSCAVVVEKRRGFKLISSVRASKHIASCLGARV